MIPGYRWLKTGPGIWHYESRPPRPRLYHGIVCVWPDGTAWFSAPVYSGRAADGGERPTVRAAKDAVEDAVRRRLGTEKRRKK